jgi:hypothetical protein
MIGGTRQLGRALAIAVVVGAQGCGAYRADT